MSEHPATHTSASAPTTAPVSASERLEFVDILRGFALLGVFIANMYSFAGQDFSLGGHPDTLDRAVRIGIQFFVQAKFYTMFSFLFGWGMSIQFRRAKERGVRFVPLFLRRMLILALFGLIHGILIWRGDILFTYAYMGVLLLLFRNWPPRRLLILCVILLGFSIVLTLPGGIVRDFNELYAQTTAFLRTNLLSPAVYGTGTFAEITQRRYSEFLSAESWALYTFGNIFAMFLLGLYVGKREIFSHVERHLPLIKRTLVISLVVGVIFNSLYTLSYIWNTTGEWPTWIEPRYYRTFNVATRTIGAPAFMLFYTSAIILITRRESGFQRLRPLGGIGRMALSNYLFQSLIGTLIFYNYGLGLYGEMGAFFSLLLTLLIFFFQIRFSNWWLEQYQFGPMEWLWRTLTYGKRQPMRRGRRIPDEREPTRWTKLGRTTQIVILVVALIVLALIAWGYRSATRSAETAFVSQTAQIESTPIVPPPTATPDVDATPVPIATPIVEPVAYNPGVLAASGDAAALAALFDPERAMVDIEVLTGAPFFGRYAGSPQEQAAAEYIADQFATYGLQPVGDNGTFFQPFPIATSRLASSPTLSITALDGSTQDDYAPYRDFTPIVVAYAGNGDVEGAVVWVNKCDQEDFKSVKVVNQIVFCEPEFASQAARHAVEHGAAGLLVLDRDRPADFAGTFREVWVPEPIPVFRVSAETAADLLVGSDTTVEELSINFLSFPLQTEARLTIETVADAACAEQPCTSRNVLGVLPGRNAAYADEVVVIGAHYDHLGESPSGVQWVGANDNASGVAALLEIARVWHDTGFVPQRTVVFVAFGAEELGLLGSLHYVDNPRYPLDKTIGMLNLDMVGGGEDTLYIDSQNGLEALLAPIAASKGISTTISTTGRSDHIPFQVNGVPASLLIWFGGEDGVPSYHRSIDTIDVIEPDKLEAAGEIAMLAALNLVEIAPRIDSLLVERGDAVLDNDRAAFLATSAESQHAADISWLADAAELTPDSVTFSAESLQIDGTTATAETTIQVVYPVEIDATDVATKTISVNTDIRFVHDGAQWLWAGVDLESAEIASDSNFTVQVAPGQAAIAADLAQVADEQFSSITSQLDLPGDIPATIRVYDGLDALRADAAMTLSASNSTQSSADGIRLLYSEEITTTPRLTTALVQLALAQQGIIETDAPWLWNGLPPFLAVENGATTMPLAELQKTFDLETPIIPVNEATNWAAVDYLVGEMGRDKLGQFIRAVGQVGVDRALTSVAGISAETFESAWQATWQEKLVTTQNALDTIVARRTDTILSGDKTGFLSTLDPTIARLHDEQSAWFDDLELYPAQQFTATVEPVTLLPDGGVLANVTISYMLDNATDRWGNGSVTQQVLFTPEGNGLRWSGVPFETVHGDGVEVHFPTGHADVASAILAEAQSILPQISSNIGATLPTTTTISLYDDERDLRSSVALSFPTLPWISGWSGANGTTKLLLHEELRSDGDLSAELRATLIKHLTRSILLQQGDYPEWVLKGIAAEQAVELDDRLTEQWLYQNLRHVVRDITNDRLTTLDAIPTDRLITTEDDHARLTAQSWDVIHWIVDNETQSGLLALLSAYRRGGDENSALQSATGMDSAEFTTTWTTSLLSAHARPEFITTAEQFNIERAVAHVAALSAPELAGRRAGSDEAQLAADYIADQFAAAGLQPVAPGQFLTEPMTATAELSYFQPYTIEYATLPFAPALTVSADNESIGRFQYRQDFLDAFEFAPYGAAAAGDLVWIKDGNYTDMNLTGKIALRAPDQNADLSAEIERAVNAGAAGLLLASDVSYNKTILSKSPLPAIYTEPSIPVFLLTEVGFDAILDATGNNRVGLNNAPPALDLGLHAALDIPLSPPTAVENVNVLGLLPGSDPALRDEVIIISAHYDHVGNDPDALFCGEVAIAAEAQFDPALCERIPGLAYPGINDNATGVAVLLEIAQLWQETGYQPQRSILFAAWGAQEPGEIGSQFYVDHPVFDLEDSVSVPIDAVGGGAGFRMIGHANWSDMGQFLLTTSVAEDLLEGRTEITIPQLSEGDYLPFATAGVPTMFVTWTDISEDNWPTEYADALNPTHLGTSGRMLTFILMNSAR